MENVKLHFDDYNRIGRVQKRLNPGLYDRYTDEQVGVVAIEQGRFSPDKYLAAKTTGADMVAGILNLDNKPGWFEGLFQVGREERKNRILAQRGQQASAVIEFQKKKIESLQLDFELQHLPEMLAAAEFIRELQMEFQVHVMEDQRKELVHKDILRTAAAKAELTIEGHISEKLAEAASKRKLEEQKEELKAAFEDHERRETLKVDLNVREYTEKSKATLEAAMSSDRMVRERMKELDDLILRHWELQNDQNVPPELKARRLRPMEARMAQLEAELGLERTTQAPGKETSGDDDGGAGQPPESGREPQTPVGHTEQSHTAKNTRRVN